uniref:Cytochrome p450 n=1 Tax=Croton stellatopilosus TaxID=431156 RepID=A0A3G2CJU0_9ROSI|nr:cytochrome p450 [Croton stellatopilosus]
MAVTEILLLILLPLLLLPIFLLYFLNKPTTSRLPPGPKGLPLIGNLLQLDYTNIAKHLWLLSQNYGPLMSLKIGSRPTLIISSAEMAKQVLKTQDLEFCNRPLFAGPQRLSYNGIDLIFSPYGNYYREIRKICIVYLFNSNKMNSFRPIREDEVSRMIGKISKLAEESKPVNLTEHMMALTSGLICRVAFGRRYEDGGSEAKRFHRLLNETQFFFVAFFFSDYFPRFGWVLDKFSGMFSRLEKHFEEFDGFLQGLVDEQLNPNKEKPVSERGNILDVLLQFWKEDSIKDQEFTLDHVKSILLDVFVAGSDTSAAAVIWAMSFLMRRPELMKKAQDEVRNIVGNSGFVSDDDIQKLPYLKAVIKEIMRLQPTGPLLVPRETMQETNLGGFKIPEKTLVHINAFAIGRDPDVWEKPLEFNPDRFMNSEIDMIGQNFELIPFGAGRRICPGIIMGIANLELSLANLLYKFNWEMPARMKREDIDLDRVLPGLAVHKKDHLFLVPKKHI